jgi:hypothetical protein
MMPHIVKADAGKDQGTTSSSPGRSYTVGIPLGLTLNDDGSIDVVAYLGEVNEAIADGEGNDDIDDDTAVADAATIAAAIEAGNVRITYSKGA